MPGPAVKTDRQTRRLDATAVGEAIKESVGLRDEKTGRLKITKHSDGQSLYLLTRDGLGWWQYQWREGSKSRSKMLGSAADMSPSRARIKREEHATERRKGRTVERRGAAVRRANPEAAGKLFGDVVTEFIEGYWLPVKGADPAWMPGAADSWKGKLEGGEAKSYRRTLLKRGTLAARPVAEIDTDDVQHHLAGWNDKPVTREKVRFRIEIVLNNAKSRGFCDGDNPASADIFKHLPGPKADKVEHHPAMLSENVPTFMVDLLALGTVASRALAFTILTAARTNETLEMRWREVDFKNKVWIVPASRMKETEEHRVPLSPEALKLIGKPGMPDDHVFPSPEKGPASPIWNKAMPDILHKFLKRGKISTVDNDRCPVPHGFRTTFSGDWGVKNKFPLELRDMALAHAVGDHVVKAYNRPLPELYKVRIPMMLRWSKFVCSKVKL
jgi:integrase